jgi:hypothetical protein
MPDFFNGAGMSAATQRIPVYVLEDLVWKLNPKRFPGIPPTLVALTGFVLGAAFFTSDIRAVVIIHTGIVLARVDGNTDESRVLGSYSNLLRNWIRLISRAGLSPHEFMEVQVLSAEKVGFLGPTNAGTDHLFRLSNEKCGVSRSPAFEIRRVMFPESKDGYSDSGVRIPSFHWRIS